MWQYVCRCYYQAGSMMRYGVSTNHSRLVMTEQQPQHGQRLQQAAAGGDVMAGIEYASYLLENAAPDSSDHQRGLQHLQTALDGPHAAFAHWALAAHYLQHMTLPGPR